MAKRDVSHGLYGAGAGAFAFAYAITVKKCLQTYSIKRYVLGSFLIRESKTLCNDNNFLWPDSGRELHRVTR